ncbi:MAG: tetratricopeptide repeat protein [Planctomycetes bacterium]|nr:tetratricopeptide repeat protein [Planctomycetota bacterium]
MTRKAAAALALLALCSCAGPEPSFADSRAADHNRAGAGALRGGDLIAAKLHFTRALEHATALADRPRQVDALNNLGILDETMGLTEEALAFYERALALADPARGQAGPFAEKYLQGVYSASLNRSRLLLAAGDAAGARVSLDLAADAAAEIGSRVARASCQKQRALLELEAGEAEQALDLAREAVRLLEISPDSAANVAALADARLVLGRLLERQGDRIGAIAQYNEAAELARRVSDRTLTAVALEAIARALATLGHLEDAALRYRMAFDVNWRIPHLARARQNVLALKGLAQQLERSDLARECDELLAEIDAAAGMEKPVPQEVR